jgi:hypothetical protein
MVDCPRGIVRSSRGVVRPPVLLGTRPCALVCREAFKGLATHRLVADSVSMGASACVNVETPVVKVEARALLVANAERMVSATSVLAGNTVGAADTGLERASGRTRGAPRCMHDGNDDALPADDD